MLLSRAKPAQDPAQRRAPIQAAAKQRQLPRLEEFLKKRDYVGAVTLLEFMKSAEKPLPQTEEWLGYCKFHLGDFPAATKVYEGIVQSGSISDSNIWVYLACCYFITGRYQEADEAAQKAPVSSLQIRLLFHLSHKFNDEDRLMHYHSQLKDVTHDQLTLASIHYLRNHYQEAIDIYKKVITQSPQYAALDVYIALCYYKLDYYDVSQEVLGNYLKKHPDSATTLNLRACNHFRLFNGKEAEQQLQELQNMASPSFEYAQDLIKHNLVVFRSGEGALQVLPPLIDVLPEARLNLVIYFLRENELQEAHELLQDLDPATPQEYILKGVVNAARGQELDNEEHLRLAQQYFQLVGGSASECDTIPGRQCMASCFFLIKQYDDVLIYLNSIKDYFYNDDTFNFNYGQALAAAGKFREAEEALLLVQSERARRDFCYLGWLTRCYIMNRKPRLAWELYLKMETSRESYNVLNLIANDCYKMGQFYYAAKAFHVLEAMDPLPEFWEGKRGACVGVFQQVIAQQEPRDSLGEVYKMLKGSSQGSPRVEMILRTIQRWARENRVDLGDVGM